MSPIETDVPTVTKTLARVKPVSHFAYRVMSLVIPNPRRIPMVPHPVARPGEKSWTKPPKDRFEFVSGLLPLLRERLILVPQFPEGS